MYLKTLSLTLKVTLEWKFVPQSASNAKALLQHAWFFVTKIEITDNEKRLFFKSEFWFHIEIVWKSIFFSVPKIYASVPVANLFQNDADSLAYVKKTK